MTNRQLAELIQRQIAGGTPSDDFEPKLEEIALWIPHGVAAAARVNYTDGVNVDGIEFVGDAFYTTIKNLALTLDEDTGWYQTTLPTLPYGLSTGYDITAMRVQGDRQVSDAAIRIPQRQVSFYDRMRLPPNKLFFWVEGKTVNVKSFAVLDGMAVRVTMATPGTGGLDADMNCPDDYIPMVVDYVKKQLLTPQPQPPDLSNDGVNVK